MLARTWLWPCQQRGNRRRRSRNLRLSPRPTAAPACPISITRPSATRSARSPSDQTSELRRPRPDSRGSPSPACLPHLPAPNTPGRALGLPKTNAWELQLLGHGDGSPAPARDEGAQEGVGGRLLRLVSDGGVEVAELVVAEFGQDAAQEGNRWVREREVVRDEVLKLPVRGEGEGVRWRGADDVGTRGRDSGQTKTSQNIGLRVSQLIRSSQAETGPTDEGRPVASASARTRVRVAMVVAV